jgi:hypothetical protein
MASSTIAPSVAVRMDPKPNPVPPERPNKRSAKPPTKAPAIPMSAVTKMPPGSGPGMTHFARTPATNPTTIKAMMAPMPMRFHLP